MTEFLHMGGYAVYVWPAFGVSALVLGVNLWWPWRHHRQLRRMLAEEGR